MQSVDMCVRTVSKDGAERLVMAVILSTLEDLLFCVDRCGGGPPPSPRYCRLATEALRWTLDPDPQWAKDREWWFAHCQYLELERYQELVLRMMVEEKEHLCPMLRQLVAELRLLRYVEERRKGKGS